MTELDAAVERRPMRYAQRGTAVAQPLSGTARQSARSHRITLVLATADLLALLLSVAVAGVLADVVSQWILTAPFQALRSSDLLSRLAIWISLSVAVVAWFLASGHYTIRRPLREDFPRIFSSLCVVLLIDGFIQFATRSDFSRAWLVMVWLLAAIAVPLARIAVRGVLDRMGLWRLRAVVIGHGDHIATVQEGLCGDSYLGYSFVENSAANWFSIFERAELKDRIGDFAAQNGLDVVVLVPSHEELLNADRLIDALNIQKIRYAIVPPISRLPLAGLEMQAFLSSDAVLMTVRSGLLNPLRRALKRVFDLLASIAILILLAPLLLVIAVMVGIDGGPIMFGHERIGQNGRRFKCLKFRSMVPDAPAVLERLLASDNALRQEWQTTYKLKNDPRVTVIGRFLRKTSLDELPQLLNVLRGRMSLVGPRPVVASELSEYYGADAMYYRLVRPGITGLWQISGRSDVGYERRVHLDAWYVRNWSLWTDILILLGTVPSVLRSKGAY